MGHAVSEETRKKLSRPRKGHEGHAVSEETRKKLSEANKSYFSNPENRKKSMGKNGSNWQGGITPESAKIRHGVEYRLWREAVFARDNWTCQKCGQNGKNLHAHHIYNFSKVIELRTSIENGITLCKKCHKAFHDKYGYKNNTREQLEEFLSNK